MILTRRHCNQYEVFTIMGRQHIGVGVQLNTICCVVWSILSGIRFVQFVGVTLRVTH
jgi:hypothetical protein